jgi:hypothetical protein
MDIKSIGLPLVSHLLPCPLLKEQALGDIGKMTEFK